MSGDSHKKCVHCGAHLPSDCEGSFCCSGCEHVYNLIQSEGLSEFYRLLDVPIQQGKHVHRDVKKYDWLQDQLEEAELRANGRTAELKLKVKGVRCKACSWLIEQLFYKTESSQHCEVDISKEELTLWWIKGGFDIREFAVDLEMHGYVLPKESKLKTSAEPLLSLCLATTFSALISMVCILPGWMNHQEIHADYYGVVSVILFLSGTLSFFIGGGFFIAATVKRLRPWMRYWPAACASILGYAVCLYGWLEQYEAWSHFEIYACSVSAYMWGRYLVERLKNYYEASFVGEDLLPYQFLSNGADGENILRPINELKKGASYSVSPGQLVPVCSELVSDNARISLGYRGRDKLFSFNAPQRVPVGSLNKGNNSMRLKALEGWKDSDLHKQMDLLGAYRTPNPGNWPQWGGILFSVFYVSVAVSISLVLNMPLHEMALPICAVLLVLSTGSLSWGRHWLKRLTLLRLASYGMYVPNINSLKRLLRVNYVRFNEPGWIVLNPPQLENDTPLDMLTKEQRGVLLAMIGKGSHPVAGALMERLLQYSCDIIEIENFKEVIGSGYMGIYKGEVWSVGLIGWHERNSHQMVQKNETWDLEFFHARKMLCTIAFSEVDVDKYDQLFKKLKNEYGIILQRSEIATPSFSEDKELVIGDTSGKSLKMIPVIGRRWLAKKAEIFLFGGQLNHLIDLFDNVRKYFRVKRRTYSWIILYHTLMLLLIFGAKLSIISLIFLAPVGSLLGILIMGEGFRRKRKLV